MQSFVLLNMSFKWNRNNRLLSVFCCRCKDSLFTLATTLRPHELDTFSTKYLTVSVSQCTANQAPDYTKTEPLATEEHNCNDSEENNTYDCKTEKSVISAPKRPGWFGKGYAKVKKPSKKRRIRWWRLAVSTTEFNKYIVLQLLQENVYQPHNSTKQYTIILQLLQC